MVWFLSKNFNVLITGFNKVTRNGKDELWITEINGASRKVAEGDNATELENYLLDLVWNNFPSIIVNENNIGANVKPIEEEFEEQI